MRIFLCVIAVVMLAGCASPAERALQMRREVDQMVAVYGPACERLGYQADTDLWRDCILRLDARDTYWRGYPWTTDCRAYQGLGQCPGW